MYIILGHIYLYFLYFVLGCSLPSDHVLLICGVCAHCEVGRSIHGEPYFFAYVLTACQLLAS